MADIIADVVLETSTTVGTGPVTLAGAVPGNIPFSAAPGLVDGSTCDYGMAAVDAIGNPTGDFETGSGRWNTGGTLTSLQVYSSSNGGAKVSWSTGTKRVGMMLTAHRLADLVNKTTLQPLAYTMTGSWVFDPQIVLTAPPAIQTSTGVINYSGKWAGALSLSGQTSVTVLDFTDLEGLTASAVTSGAGLTSLTFSALKVITTQFSPSGASVTTFGIPVLEYIGGQFSPSTMAITSLSAPALKTVFSNLTLGALTSLTSMSLPVIERINPGTTGVSTVFSSTTSTAALATLTIGSTLKQVGGTAGNVVFTSCALNQASVDNLLVRLAALDGTAGTVAFSNRTVTITGTSATPSATGLAAKAILVARSCTVTHN